MALDALSDAISFSCQLTASREADVLEYADQYQYTVYEVWEYVRKNSSPEMEADCHLGNKSIAEIQQKLRQMGLM